MKYKKLYYFLFDWRCNHNGEYFATQFPLHGKKLKCTHPYALSLTWNVQ